MILARVSGSIIAAVRADGIDGPGYRIVEPCSPSGITGKSTGIVVLDLVGAAPDEFVLVSQGSSTRQTDVTKDKPVDAVIIGIVDIVEEEGEVVFRK
ncbi:MAG: EutN/CcmL family microcompartment protein [Spirochaetales bacterium]|nr:EutN/CcmL family microcompartment protein [Spirochaetales bacterium]